MINVLIADDNVEYAVNLMNYINKKNENIKTVWTDSYRSKYI